MLAHVAGAVASKTAELDGEAQRFAAAVEAGKQASISVLPRCATLCLPAPVPVMAVATVTREALSEGISPGQFAALFRALSAKADSAFALCGTLPQARVCVDGVGPRRRCAPRPGVHARSLRPLALGRVASYEPAWTCPWEASTACSSPPSSLAPRPSPSRPRARSRGTSCGPWARTRWGPRSTRTPRTPRSSSRPSPPSSSASGAGGARPSRRTRPASQRWQRCGGGALLHTRPL